MLEQLVSEGLHQLGGTHTGAACKELHSMGRTDFGKVHGGLSPMEEPQTEAGEKCEYSSPWAAETTCDELIAVLIPHLPLPLWVKK